MNDDPVRKILDDAEQVKPMMLPIHSQDQQTMLGIVSMLAINDPATMFDYALTPVVTFDPHRPDLPPKITGWMASPRTMLDTRPRSPEPPFDHIGEEVAALMDRTIIAHVRAAVQQNYDNHLGLDATLQRIGELVGVPGEEKS